MTDDDPELALLRRKKMAELIEREKRRKAEAERKQKVDAERAKLLRRFLTPDAVTYLEHLKESQPGIGRRVEDVILYLIVYQGYRQTVTRTDLMYVERQLKGEGPRIRVQRDGEVSDFGSYVRDAVRRHSSSD